MEKMTSPNIFKGDRDMDYNDLGARAPASEWAFLSGRHRAFDSDKWTQLWRPSKIIDATGRELKEESEVENQYISRIHGNREKLFFPSIVFANHAINL